MIRQFTATVYIFHKGKMLLHQHKKHGKWLPAGGHIEANETPEEAALREVKEETGLEVELIPQENLWVEYKHAKSLHRPFFCLLEDIPARGSEPAHQHMDLVYLAHPKEPFDETADLMGFQWFFPEEVLLFNDDDIFADTKEIIQTLSLELDFFSVSADS